MTEPVDLSQKRLLHDQAADLLAENGLFMSAVKAVRIKWFDELMASHNTEQKLELVARLQALLEVPVQLQTAVNDYKIAAARQRHG